MFKRSYFISLILVFSLLMGCSSASEVTTSKASDLETSTTEITTTEPSVTETSEVELEPYDYTLDYHKASEFMYEYYGEHAINLAVEAIDAFFAGENSIVIEDFRPGDMHYIYACACQMCPVFSGFTERNPNFDYDEVTHVLSWRNMCTPEEAIEHSEELSAVVASYFDSLKDTDDEMLRATQLYYDFSCRHLYDYDYLDSMSTMSNEDNCYYGSSFYVLKEDLGICYNLSNALTFLYIQADINAIPVGSMGNESSVGAHEWMLVQIDGLNYYMDPTWDLGFEVGSCSLQHFGMTIDERELEGGYLPADSYMYPHTYINETDLVIDDIRFASLHGYAFSNVLEFEVDHVGQRIIATDLNGNSTVIE